MKEDTDIITTPVFMITSGNNNESHNGLSLQYMMLYKKLLKQHPKVKQELISEFLMFVSECFGKDVEYGNNYDYILSAWLANKFFHEFEDGKIESIVFPSVQQSLRMSNNAIKPAVFERKYKLVSVEESLVVQQPNALVRGYVLKGINQTKDFDLE